MNRENADTTLVPTASGLAAAARALSPATRRALGYKTDKVPRWRIEELMRDVGIEDWKPASDAPGSVWDRMEEAHAQYPLMVAIARSARRQGYTATGLAEAARIAPDTIQKMARGQHHTHVLNLLMIIEVLGAKGVLVEALEITMERGDENAGLENA